MAVTMITRRLISSPSLDEGFSLVLAERFDTGAVGVDDTATGLVTGVANRGGQKGTNAVISSFGVW